MKTAVLQNPKKHNNKQSHVLYAIFLPFFHSSSQGSAWQDQSLAQRPQQAWSSTYRLGMFCGCTARRCWTSARCHPHTATDPGTDLQPRKRMMEWDWFNREYSFKKAVNHFKCHNNKTTAFWENSESACVIIPLSYKKKIYLSANPGSSDSSLKAKSDGEFNSVSLAD